GSARRPQFEPPSTGASARRRRRIARSSTIGPWRRSDRRSESPTRRDARLGASLVWRSSSERVFCVQGVRLGSDFERGDEVAVEHEAVAEVDNTTWKVALEAVGDEP